MAEMHQRIKKALEFAQESPVLQLGEHGLESDTGLFKIGDGVTRWNRLEYANGGEGGSTPSPSAPVNAMVVVPHGTDPNFPRPAGVTVAYWLGSVEPANAVDDDLWSGDVDVP